MKMNNWTVCGLMLCVLALGLAATGEPSFAAGEFEAATKMGDWFFGIFSGPVGKLLLGVAIVGIAFGFFSGRMEASTAVMSGLAVVILVGLKPIVDAAWIALGGN